MTKDDTGVNCSSPKTYATQSNEILLISFYKAYNHHRLFSYY